jgi:hypothetical protein
MVCRIFEVLWTGGRWKEKWRTGWSGIEGAGEMEGRAKAE